MKSKPSFRPSLALVIVLLVALPAGCKKKSSGETAQQAPAPAPPPPSVAPAPVAVPAGASTAQDTIETAPDWLAQPSVTPGTTVLKAVDPHSLSATEVEYGVAPKLSKDVDYQPNVIVMEQGDKAIKSVAGDGLTWTFDANAPHVSEFEEGKIVFATGRAVGKVQGLKKNGSTISVILAPVQLSEIIKRGRFVMDEEVDPNKMISYVAPDYPGTNDTTGMITTSYQSVDDGNRSGVKVSLATQGKWVPTELSRREGERLESRKVRRLPRWARNDFAAADAELAALRRKQVGAPQGIIPHAPALDPLEMPPSNFVGPLPQVNLENQDVEIKNVSNSQYLGLKYTYDKHGMLVVGAGYVTLHAPRIRCVLSFNADHSVDSAGIEIKGAAGVRVRLEAHDAIDHVFNLHLQQFVPINISIPLGGPVPLSLTFATFFNINTGFSAKSSIDVAEGMYNFQGGVWAGRTNSGWHVSTPASFTTVKSLGGSIAGLSLGINSFTLGFGIRSMVGLGAFGFASGVFATVRFGGSIIISPNEAYGCRQGIIDGFIDTGVGYQIPKPFAVVINFFLGAIGVRPIDAVGTLAVGPTRNLFSDDISIPHGCASAKTG